jgi:hypothetical protein
VAEVANLWDGHHAVSTTTDMLQRAASVLNTDFGGYKCALSLIAVVCEETSLGGRGVPPSTGGWLSHVCPRQLPTNVLLTLAASTA